MSRRIASMTTSVALACSLVLACSSCAQLDGKRASTDERDEHASPAQRRVAQFSFGREASFGVCVEPGCPRATPKTLAGAQPVAQPVALPEPPRPLPSALPVRLEVAPTQPAAPITEPPKMREPEPIRQLVVGFGFGSAQLDASARTTLDASIRDARRADRIVISGRTDVVGDSKVNQALALARALAVRDHLRTVAPDLAATIAIDAQGRCCFIASNTDEAGRARNRRVEVVFLAAGGA